jgi:hypothetical protein
MLDRIGADAEQQNGPYAVMCAIWQPVARANDADLGMPSSSFTQVPQISSTTASAGAVRLDAAF